MSLNNEAEKYLNSLLSLQYYGLDNIVYESVDENKIYDAVVSSRFRKSKIDEITIKDIKNKIRMSLDHDEPLKFAVPFGAYKAWRLNMDFQPDWAEVFNISYYLKYAVNILKYYSKGIEIAYTFSDNLMYFVSDIPKNKAENYAVVFEDLLGLFNQLSDKIQFKLVRINDLYNNQEEYYIDFLKCFLDNLVFWDSKYDESVKSRHLNSSYHNLYLYGERNVGDKSEDVREKYYYYSALMTDAVDCLKERRKYNKNQDRIQLVSVKGPSKCINMGACETSAVHFWTGRGFLKYNKNIIKPYIYTQSSIKKIETENIVVDLYVDTIFKTISKNYEVISFIKEEKRNEKN